MARISTYKKDTGLDPKDKLVGSSYVGLTGGIPSYTTSSYTLDDIAKFLTGYQYLGDDAFFGWTLQTKISDAFLSNSNGDIIGFKEIMKQASEQIVLDMDLSTNAIIDGIIGQDGSLAQLFQTTSTANDAIDKISNAFTFDGNGYPTGFGETIEENIYGLAQVAIDLTPYVLAEGLIDDEGILTKLREAFTFDENGNVDNFNTTLATASADQVRGIFVSDGLAYGADVDKIKTAVGTFDEDGNLLNLSEGLSQKISTVISTDTATLALQIDGVQAAFGTFDPETGELISYSTALNNHVSSVVSGDGYAASLDLDTLETFVKGEDGTGGLVGSISAVNELAGTANSTASAAAFKATSLGSVFGTYDEEGNFTPSATSSYFESIKTYVNNDSAVAEKAENLRITVGDANSGLVAQANDVTTLAGTIDGHLKATRTINVDANGNVASMQLLADENSSEIRFSADSFKVFNGTEGVAPFEVVGGQVKIKSANIGSVSFGDLADVPDTFITTVIYADDASGTNPSTTKGTKNFVAFYNGAAKWVNGDPLPSGLTFSQIRGDDGAQGPAGADGQDGADGYTPQKNIDYFDGLDGSNGVDGTDGAPGIDGESANVVVTNASSEQCPNGGKVYQFYVGTTLIDTQIVCNGIDGADGAAGTPGAAGAAGIRIATGLLFYQLGSETQPSTPSNSGITYNFDNGTFSSLPTNWGLGTPEMAAGTASNKYWTSRYQVIESSSGSNSGTPSFFTPIRSFAFNQVVTFDSLGSSGTTVIDGSRISTGFIRSEFYDGPDVGETFADQGTALYLNSGAIISKNFVIDTNGNASFRGYIEADSGTFSGNVTGATISGGTINIGSGNFTVNSSGDMYIAGNNTIAGNLQMNTGSSINSGLVGGWALDRDGLSLGAEILDFNNLVTTANSKLEFTGQGKNSEILYFQRVGYPSPDSNNYSYLEIKSDGFIKLKPDMNDNYSFDHYTIAYGDFRATGNITAYYSDDRLKTRLGNITDPLDKIKTLNGFQFKLNEEGKSLGFSDESVQIGVSAQEVQKVLPQIVKPAPINENYLTVQYERLVPLLIEGIKELTERLERLEEENKNLKG